MFESYNTRITDYNHQIGQGDLVKQNLVIVQLSYLISALTNTKLFIRYNYLILNLLMVLVITAKFLILVYLQDCGRISKIID